MLPSRSFLLTLHSGAMEMPAHSIDRPQRLVAAMEASRGASSKKLALSSREATVEELARTHELAYVAGIREASERSEQLGPIQLDPELRLVPGSYQAAAAAAGSALNLAQRLSRGGTQREVEVMLNRPGSHHAGFDYALGFCVFNNLAVAANELRRLSGARVAIFDFDAHHGNGTEEIFADREDVLTISIHQSPFFPGGGVESPGVSNLNIPLASGCSDAEGWEAWELAREALSDFRPDALLLEAGLDSHAEDWTTGLEMSDQFFYRLGEGIGHLQTQLHCALGIELGGGYTDRAVRGGFEALLRGLDR